jgi:glycosyltransferase involved in cell wall biosynthesis
MSMSILDEPVSIGYFSPGWPASAFPNGIIPYVAILAEQLESMGHSATVIAGRVAPGENGNPVYDLESGSARPTFRQRVVEGLGYRVSPSWGRDRVFRRKLSTTVKRVIAERGIQLLEIEESFGFARWLQQDVSIPICVRLHGPWFLNGAAVGAVQDKAFDHRVKLEEKLIRNAVAITSPSRDTLEQTRAYYGLSLEHAQVIPAPVYPVAVHERWALEGCDPKRVLFIGRFDRHKGADLLIDAFAHVLEQIPDARLTFVGPDPGLLDDEGRHWNLESYVRDRVPGAIESGAVTLMGHRPHAALGALRRSAIVTVVCSRYENFPLTVVEAKAMGCPVVAAAVGGIPEIIEHETDGLLYQGGSVEDLAAKIVTMINNPDLAATLGRQTAERCESFYPEAVAARSLDYYGNYLERSSILSSARGAS